MKEGLTERNGWEIMSTAGVSIAPMMAQREEKKVGTGRKTRTLSLDILGWTPVSSHVRKPKHLLFSSLRLFGSRFSASRTAAPTAHPVFLFDTRIQLEAIFTVSAAA